MRDQIAAAILLNDDRVLLCLRSHARRWFPGVWDLPGGHIEDGETARVALVRELREELGIEARADQPAARVVTDDYEMDVFVIREWHGTVSNHAPDEHDEVSFYTLAEAAELPLADDHLLPMITRVVAPPTASTTSADVPAPLVLATTPDAPWLPPGGRADAVLARGGASPSPTGLVRLLVRRGAEVFCVARDDTGKIDLPTTVVEDLDDGRSSAEHLAQTILGASADVTLLGFVGNVLDRPAPDYPWPVPIAHFSVWEAHGDPVIEGRWLSISADGSPLRDRHWWPIVTHADVS